MEYCSCRNMLNTAYYRNSLRSPHHVNHQFLSPHDDLFEDLLSTIFSDMILGHHSIRLFGSAVRRGEK
jgi:hypothetical protein